ncbi:MAG: CRTAC1 family protein [Terriglobia bacterium]
MNRRQFLAIPPALLLAHNSAARGAAASAGGTLAPVRFRNMARASGIDFILNNNPTPEKHLIETMTGGVAAFDFDNDGRTDLFFANGASLPSLQKNSPRFFNRLYRNEGNWKFRDVTAEANVAGEGFSMGAAAADYDNDGRTDLLVTGVFRNILYHNLGNGRFEDVTQKAGIKSDKWSVAAGWFDYDNDGWLDLLVVNYAKWSISDNRYCGDRERHTRSYCHPKYFDGLPCTLYRNCRNGAFEDVTTASGLGKLTGRGMSAAFADYDGDGFLDVLVTNDNQANFLFHNRGDGTFEEAGLQAGVALLNSGEPVSSMGVDFRDYNNDGLPDIAITDLTHETYPLFRNLGHGQFEDATFASRLAMLTAPRSGWGNGFVDFNNDGWKDLFTANAHVDPNVQLFEPGTEFRQANSIFINARDGTFIDGSRNAGADFQAANAHRGAAFADFNNDGKIDVVTSSLGGAPELWENISPNQNHWIIFKLRGAKSNRDGIGARIRVGNQVNHMTSSVGYASSSHFGIHFGLGPMHIIPEVEIRWPSGKRQVLRNVSADQVLQVREPE